MAKPGSSSNWPSVSLPFSLVVTEHIALFHMRASDPPVDTIAIYSKPADLFLTRQQRAHDCLTKETVHIGHPGEDKQSMFLLLTQISNVGGFILCLRCDRRNKNMSRRGLGKEMHTPMEPWVRTFRTRPGRFLVNMAAFSRLDWKCAAATYAAVLSQLFAKACSVEE